MPKNIYFYDACHYSFSANELLDRCPDCGKIAVPLYVLSTFGHFTNYDPNNLFNFVHIMFMVSDP